MKIYSPEYQTADFISRLLPKRKGAAADAEMVRRAQASIEFVQKLAQMHFTNPRIRIGFRAGDGMTVYADGAAQMFFKPTQGFLLMHLWSKNDLYRAVQGSQRFRARPPVEYAKLLCETSSDHFEWLLVYMRKHWKPRSGDSVAVGRRRSRAFTLEMKDWAWRVFENNGRRCPGVLGKVPAHKVPEGDSIEYDHDLPWSKGGATSMQNCQVLCVSCNRCKSASPS